MKKNWLKFAVLIVACAFTLSTQAFAGNGSGPGDGTCDGDGVPDCICIGGDCDCLD